MEVKERSSSKKVFLTADIEVNKRRYEVDFYIEMYSGGMVLHKIQVMVCKWDGALMASERASDRVEIEDAIDEFCKQYAAENAA